MGISRLQKAILVINAGQLPAVPDSHIADIDPRALIAVTIFYLVVMLSVPLASAGMLIWFAAYPIVTAPLAHVAYERVFAKSLYLLPLIVVIGIFNPIYDHVTAFTVMGVDISRGWVTFISIIIRGLLSVQALLLLVHVAGFNKICDGLRGFHLPEALVTQLLMAYRYLGVLLAEVLSMQNARVARSYGRRSYPLSMWGPFVGQLLLRSLERSRRIHVAMLARGFDGSLTVSNPVKWHVADTLYCLIWITVIGAMRLLDLSSFISVK